MNIKINPCPKMEEDYFLLYRKQDVFVPTIAYNYTC